MSFANNIKFLRTQRSLSQSELASKIGVTRRHIAFIESGERTPSLGLTLKIARELGVEVGEIFLPNDSTKST